MRHAAVRGNCKDFSLGQKAKASAKHASNLSLLAYLKGYHMFAEEISILEKAVAENTIAPAVEKIFLGLFQKLEGQRAGAQPSHGAPGGIRHTQAIPLAAASLAAAQAAKKSA